MGHFFLSYLREDQRAVLGLKNELERKGVSVWLDAGLRGGDQWATEIEFAIAQADHFVVCFSRNWSSRPNNYVIREIEVAGREWARRLTEQKYFLPVLLDDASVPDIALIAEVRIREFQAIGSSGRGESLGGQLAQIHRSAAPHILKNDPIHQASIGPEVFFYPWTSKFTHNYRQYTMWLWFDREHNSAAIEFRSVTDNMFAGVNIFHRVDARSIGRVIYTSQRSVAQFIHQGIGNFDLDFSKGLTCSFRCPMRKVPVKAVFEAYDPGPITAS